MEESGLFAKIDSLFGDKGFQFGTKVSLSDEETVCLKDFLIKELLSADNGKRNLPKFCLRPFFIYLVVATRNWSIDNGSWLSSIVGSFDDKFKDIYLDQRICDCLVRLDKASDIFLFKKLRKKYYATICSYALMPEESWESFFKFLWKVYASDFSCDIYETKARIDEIVEAIEKAFSRDMNPDADLKIGATSYRILVGIRQLAVERKEILKTVVLQAFLNFSTAASGSIQVQNHIDDLQKTWWEKYECTLGSDIEKARKKALRVSDGFANLRPRYIFDNCHAYLVVPRCRFLNDFQAESKSLTLVVLTNGQPKLMRPLAISGSGLYLTSDEERIPIDDLIGDSLDFAVQIVNDDIKYDSKDALKRPFILFFGDGREATRLSLPPGNYVLFGPQDSLPPLKNLEAIKTDRFSYSIHAREGDVLSGTKPFFFEEKPSRRYWFSSEKTDDSFFERQGISYEIAKGNVEFCFSDKTLADRLGLRMRGRVLKSNDFDRLDCDGFVSFRLKEDSLLATPTTIEAFDYASRKTIDAYDVLLLPGFSYSFDRRIYYGENSRGNVRLCLPGGDIAYSFDAQQGCMVPYKDGLICLTCPIFQWRLGIDGVWKSKPENIYCGTLDKAGRVELFSSLPAKYVQLPIDNALYSFETKTNVLSAGQILEITSHLKDCLCRVVLEDDSVIDLFRIYNKPAFVGAVGPLLIDKDKKRLIFDPNPPFLGPSDEQFEVLVTSPSHLDEDRLISLGGFERKEIDVSFLHNGRYCFTLRGIHGHFGKREIDDLAKRFAVFGDSTKVLYEGSSIRIDKAVVSDSKTHESRLLHLAQPLIIRDLQFIRDSDDGHLFEGVPFRDGKNEITPMRHLKQSDGSKVFVSHARVLIMGNGKCLAGFGIDEDDPTIDWQNDFAIDTQSKYLVCQSNLTNMVYSSVDYFYFGKL